MGSTLANLKDSIEHTVEEKNEKKIIDFTTATAALALASLYAATVLLQLPGNVFLYGSLIVLVLYIVAIPGIHRKIDEET